MHYVDARNKPFLRKGYISEKKHTDNDIMMQHKAGFCFDSLFIYIKSRELCAKVTCLLYQNWKCRRPYTHTVGKADLSRSSESGGNAEPDLLLISGLKCNLPLFLKALPTLPHGGEPSCITKRVKSCSAFGSCRLG